MAQLPQQDIGELQLRLELRRRFPDVNLASIIKVMKLVSVFFLWLFNGFFVTGFYTDGQCPTIYNRHEEYWSE